MLLKHNLTQASVDCSRCACSLCKQPSSPSGIPDDCMIMGLQSIYLNSKAFVWCIISWWHFVEVLVCKGALFFLLFILFLFVEREVRWSLVSMSAVLPATTRSKVWPWLHSERFATQATEIVVAGPTPKVKVVGVGQPKVMGVGQPKVIHFITKDKICQINKLIIFMGAFSSPYLRLLLPPILPFNCPHMGQLIGLSSCGTLFMPNMFMFQTFRWLRCMAFHCSTSLSSKTLQPSDLKCSYPDIACINQGALVC